jgi:hypothetical protein
VTPFIVIGKVGFGKSSITSQPVSSHLIESETARCPPE